MVMANDDSNMNAKPLATTRSPSAYTFNRKESKPSIPLL